MNSRLQPAAVGTGQSVAADRADEAVVTDRPASRGPGGRITKVPAAIARFAWKYAVAMLCTQSIWLSVLLIGWTTRYTQRTIFKRWWRFARTKRDVPGFRDVIRSIDETASHGARPNWIVRQDFREHVTFRAAQKREWLRNCAGIGGDCFHSLWLNARTGCQVIFNTWVFTLPGCVFMLFSWEYGWNNSFYKGYEQAHIGPAMGLFGVALFIAAMTYVPMATARQAATGNWRSFYELSLVTRLIRRRVFSCVGLAALFVLVAVPVNVLKTLPGLLTGGGGEFAQRVEAMTPEQARAFLETYYFWASAALVAGFVLLRLAAGRIYASALLAEIRHGKAMPELAPAEHAVLARLDLLRRDGTKHHPVLRAVGWTAGRSGLLVAGALLVAFWFLFVAQTYAGEFLNYHSEYGLA